MQLTGKFCRRGYGQKVQNVEAFKQGLDRRASAAAAGAAPGKSSLVPSAAETMEPDVKASADQSQPQLHELPKHSKSPVAGSHASPLKVMPITITSNKLLASWG